MLKVKEERGSRRRSLSMRREPIRETEFEADYYNRRAEERGYMGEAYNGATKDWAIVDVPPGTERVKMDGIGGGSQEITWQRYNGVRRSKFIPERMPERALERAIERAPERAPERDTTITYEYERDELVDRQVGRPLPPPRKKVEEMWTEITKDLVVRQAIEERGYDFQEVDDFYYIMEYLRYVSFPF